MDIVIVVALVVLALMLFAIYQRSRGVEGEEGPEEISPIFADGVEEDELKETPGRTAGGDDGGSDGGDAGGDYG